MAGPKVIGTQPNKPIPDEFVEIEHVDAGGARDIDGTTRVKRAALGHWEARGWRAVQAPADAPVGESTEPAQAAGEPSPAATTTAGDAPAPAKTPAARRGATTGQES